MKARFITIALSISAVIMLFFGFFMCQQFRKTTWGGWTPPNRELSLSENQLSWKGNFEEKHKCKFTYIGLDDSYIDDSIIYIYIKCNIDSDLQFMLNDSLTEITENLSRSFLQNSKKQVKQVGIEVNYANIHFDESAEKLKYPITKKCHFSILRNKATKIE